MSWADAPALLTRHAVRSRAVPRRSLRLLLAPCAVITLELRERGIDVVEESLSMEGFQRLVNDLLVLFSGLRRQLQ